MNGRDRTPTLLLPAARDLPAPQAGRRRRAGDPLTRGRLAIRLAAAYGLCPGVQGALRLALETRRAAPHRHVILAGPLVHNPHVHAALEEMGIEGPPPGGIRPGPDDVVILPAFGLPPRDEEALRATGARLVETTCSSVRAVWRSAARLARDGFTVVYHGEPGHEEAEATLARIPGPWCIVRNEAEAAHLAGRIAGTRRGGRVAAGAPRFALPASPGFDPARDLDRVGLAHQTTMLASVSLRIAAVLREAAARRPGAGGPEERFRAPDTLCSATQDRQDAVEELGRAGVDLFLVVGGRDSNNTKSLAAAAARWAPALHVEGPEDLLETGSLRCRDAGAPRTLARWLPPGPVAVGVTAGASTPDAVTDAVVERLLEIGAGAPA